MNAAPKVGLRLQQPKINRFLAERHKCNCETDILSWPGPRQYVAFRGLINVMDVIWESRGWGWGCLTLIKPSTHTHHTPTHRSRERERHTERYITVQILKALFCLQSLFRNLRVANQTPPGSEKKELLTETSDGSNRTAYCFSK